MKDLSFIADDFFIKKNYDTSDEHSLAILDNFNYSELSNKHGVFLMLYEKIFPTP